MGTTIFFIDEIDNTGTLYEEVITQLYAEEMWDIVLINTKFLRSSILKLIKEFIDHEDTIFIKEFSDNPPMIYDDDSRFDFCIEEISTDFIIVREAFNLSKVDEENNNIDEKYALVLEALNTDIITTQNWDNYLNTLFLNYSGEGIQSPRVQKIVIEDVIQVFEKWRNEENILINEMIEEYVVNHDLTYDENTSWQEPFYLISKNNWEKFSFVLTINDYDIYNEDNEDYLNLIAEKYFNTGYFDEIVIKMNYLYWHDNYQKIVDWSEQNLRSALVSYRFDTLFSNTIKNRYYDEEEASFFGDIQRQNSMEEEIQMFAERLPIFREKILTNPQTYGFELEGGYFGQEGNIPNLVLGSEEFDDYKNVICNTLAISPFAKLNDTFTIIFREPKKTFFICVRGTL